MLRTRLRTGVHTLLRDVVPLETLIAATVCVELKLRTFKSPRKMVGSYSKKHKTVKIEGWALAQGWALARGNTVYAYVVIIESLILKLDFC